MTYSFYKVLHVTALFLLFVAMAGAVFAPQEKRKLWAAMHGIASLAILIAGFGLLAKLNLMKPFPTWAFVKIGLWITLGGLPHLMRRKQNLATALLLFAVVLGGIGATTAVYKPGQPPAATDAPDGTMAAPENAGETAPQ